MLRCRSASTGHPLPHRPHLGISLLTSHLLPCTKCTLASKGQETKPPPQPPLLSPNVQERLQSVVLINTRVSFKACYHLAIHLAAYTWSPLPIPRERQVQSLFIWVLQEDKRLPSSQHLICSQDSNKIFANIQSSTCLFGIKCVQDKLLSLSSPQSQGQDPMGARDMGGERRLLRQKVCPTMIQSRQGSGMKCGIIWKKVFQVGLSQGS